VGAGEAGDPLLGQSATRMATLLVFKKVRPILVFLTVNPDGYEQPLRLYNHINSV
jgi:hypothetical protein